MTAHTVWITLPRCAQGDLAPTRTKRIILTYAMKDTHVSNDEGSHDMLWHDAS